MVDKDKAPDNNGEDQTIAQALDATIAVPDLSGPLANLGEVVLDHVAFNEGTLREVPLLGTLVAIWKSGRAIHDGIIARKVVRFLCEPAKVTEAQRRAFLLKMAGDEDYTRRVADNLMLWLDALDDMQKATWLGRAFAAMVREEITREEFLRLSSAIRRVDAALAGALCGFYRTGEALRSREATPEQVDDLQGLATAGLVRTHLGTGGYGDAGGRYETNATGALFVRVVLEG